MSFGHAGKLLTTFLSQQHSLGTTVRWSAVQFHPAFCRQTLDDSGDVAVKYVRSKPDKVTSNNLG